MAPRNALVLAALLSVVCVSAAHAQSVRDQVRALNQQAVEAYHGLELDRAVQLLEQALTLAEQHNLGGQELARTHAHLGIVVIAGLSDTSRGLTHFQRALQADPNVQLDPQLSTPEISRVFREARSRLAGQTAQPSATSTQPAEGPDVSPGLTHTPFLEQLIRTPMPIYVAVAATVRASRVVVRYRSRGMRAFAELPLTAMVNGYGAEIPCGDIFEPQLEYYVVVFGEGSRELAHAGTAERPFAIRIVRARRYAPPALPGRVPPPQCSDHECPPSLPSCRRHSRTPEGSGRGRRADAELPVFHHRANVALEVALGLGSTF